MTSRVEAVAEILWHRYSPDHEDSWPSPNADEYRRVASDILSALTTEPAAPEGQQEAVATVAKVNAAGTSWNTVYPADALDKLPIGTPLYTRPAEQAVTEAGIKAALKSLHENPLSWEHPDAIRDALKAAMEAGG